MKLRLLRTGIHLHNIQYREDIDALRGLAVLLVVFYHAFPTLLRGGFIGVDVFFVISGFLITSILLASVHNQTFSYLGFYKRRIRRLFPALITVLATSIVIGWLILFPDELSLLGNHVGRVVVFILNFSLIEELGYFDVGSHYKPMLHLWTLSIEEQYYLLWPVLLMLTLRFGKSVTVGLLLGLIALSFGANLYFVENYKDEVFFHTLTRVWELGIGSLLAVYAGGRTGPPRMLLAALGLALILVTSLIVSGETLFPGWLGLLPVAGAVMILMANVQLPRWGGLVHIGLLSYPLYLWHWVVLAYAYIYLGSQPPTWVRGGAVALSYLLAWVTWKYVEKLRHMPGDRVVLLLIVALGATGLVGLWVGQQEGLPDRPHISYLDKYKLEFQRAPSGDSNCSEYVKVQLGQSRLFHYCRVHGLEHHRRLAIVGDSHAHVLFPGIAAEAALRGYGTVMLANQSCPPLVGYQWGRSPKQIEACQNQIGQIMALVTTDPLIDKVIVVTRGPVYIHGEVEGPLSLQAVELSLQKIKSPGRQTYTTYQTGLEATLSRLSAASHIEDVYYFLENPELDFLPKETLPRPFDLWGITTLQSTIPRDLYRVRMAAYRKIVTQTISALGNVTVLDPEPYLCRGNRCFAYAEGNFLYADDDHLSVFGSHYLAKKMSGEIFR